MMYNIVQGFKKEIQRPAKVVGTLAMFNAKVGSKMISFVVY